MNRKLSMMVLCLLLIITLACQSDPFAALSAEEEMQMVEALGEKQVIERAISKQKEIDRKVRYPDFSNANLIENGIWDCQESTYGKSQYWTASGQNAVFACDSLQNTYWYACDEVTINITGSDDYCIVGGIIINIE